MRTKIKNTRVSKDKKGPVLVTGAAGFIGYHVAEALLKQGEKVIGFDALTSYNDPKLKAARLKLLSKYPGFSFVKGLLEKKDVLQALVEKTNPRAIIHLAAQAGVRYSQENPRSYIESNVQGTLSVLEAAKEKKIPVVYASSSSVYGERGGVFKETDPTDAQVSLYAATKKSSEMLAEAYSALYGIPLVGLRFFTVYGPYMRTDLAMFKFARLLLLQNTIPLYANGKGKRSYTHVSFVVDGVLHALQRIQSGHVIYNLGDERTVETTKMLQMLSKNLGCVPKIKLMPPQKGDVMMTRASGIKAKRALGVSPRVTLEEGVAEFAAWFKEHKNFLLTLSDLHS